MTTHQCIAVLGGAFDPVHNGHVALAELFCDLLKPTQLRIMPTGRSSQKTAFVASPEQRVAMLTLALAELSKKTSLSIDTQEIQRAAAGAPSYSVDTLTLLRDELGSTASLVLIIGADQLQQLHRWHKWMQLFDLAHIAVATRPGYKLDALDTAVASEFKRRLGNIDQLQNKPHGHTYLSKQLAVDISSTEIRGENGLSNQSTLHPSVVDYIKQHHLY